MVKLHRSLLLFFVKEKEMLSVMCAWCSEKKRNCADGFSIFLVCAGRKEYRKKVQGRFDRKAEMKKRVNPPELTHLGSFVSGMELSHVFDMMMTQFKLIDKKDQTTNGMVDTDLWCTQH